MRKVIEQVVDDLTGEIIEGGAGRTVQLGFQGKQYELDLSLKNLDELSKVLEPYISAARRAGTTMTQRPAVKRREGGASSKSRWSAGYSVVREWAQANGVEVSSQGRVADSVMQAYEDAHKK